MSDDDNDDNFTTWDRAGFILTRCIGFISVCCSCYLIQDIVLSKQRRCKSTYHRILLGLSISFLILSFFGSFLSSWLMPVGSAYGATGTTATCTMQGFLTQGCDLAAPLYHGSLVTFNVLEQVWKWPSGRIRKIEWILHALPLGIAWSIAIAGACLQLYNPSSWSCWIAASPRGCKQSYHYGDDEANCVRGDNAFIYRTAFLYAQVWATMIYCAIGFAMIYYEMLKQDRRMDEYNFNGEHDRTWSKRYAKNALLYVVAFFLTWIFPTCYRILQAIAGVDFDPGSTGAQVLAMLTTIFFPLHPVFIFAVYVRPRYVQYCQENNSFLSRLSCCCWIKNNNNKKKKATNNNNVTKSNNPSNNNNNNNKLEASSSPSPALSS